LPYPRWPTLFPFDKLRDFLEELIEIHEHRFFTPEQIVRRYINAITSILNQDFTISPRNPPPSFEEQVTSLKLYQAGSDGYHPACTATLRREWAKTLLPQFCRPEFGLGQGERDALAETLFKNLNEEAWAKSWIVNATGQNTSLRLSSQRIPSNSSAPPPPPASDHVPLAIRRAQTLGELISIRSTDSQAHVETQGIPWTPRAHLDATKARSVLITQGSSYVNRSLEARPIYGTQLVQDINGVIRHITGVSALEQDSRFTEPPRRHVSEHITKRVHTNVVQYPERAPEEAAFDLFRRWRADEDALRLEPAKDITSTIRCEHMLTRDDNPLLWPFPCSGASLDEELIDESWMHITHQFVSEWTTGRRHLVAALAKSYIDCVRRTLESHKVTLRTEPLSWQKVIIDKPLNVRTDFTLAIGTPRTQRDEAYLHFLEHIPLFASPELGLERGSCEELLNLILSPAPASRMTHAPAPLPIFWHNDHESTITHRRASLILLRDRWLKHASVKQSARSDHPWFNLVDLGTKR